MEIFLGVAFGQSATATDPTYTNISSYIRPKRGRLTFQDGRETEVSEATPGRLNLTLDNSGHEFTTGGIYALAPSLQVIYQVIVAGEVFESFSGWLQPAEQPDWTENDGANLIVVSALDRLGRLDKDQQMDSLLTEHIRMVGGTRLVAYWPLGETAFPVGLSKVVGQADLQYVESASSSHSAAPRPSPLLVPAGGEAAPGDELLPPLFVPYEPINPPTGFHVSENAYLRADLAAPITITTGEVLTLVFWARVSEGEVFFPTPIILSGVNALVRVDRWDADTIPDAGWSCEFDDGASWEVTSWVHTQAEGGLVMVVATARPGGLQEFGLSNAVGVNAVTGSPPASMTFETITVGFTTGGSVWHVQLYVADEADRFSETERYAQLMVGLKGYAGQSADERVRTIAALAGIPDGDLDLDVCPARMQVLRTEGKTPLQAMREAAVTEQGRLFASTDRRLVLHNRTRGYMPSDH